MRGTDGIRRRTDIAGDGAGVRDERKVVTVLRRDQGGAGVERLEMKFRWR